MDLILGLYAVDEEPTFSTGVDSSRLWRRICCRSEGCCVVARMRWILFVALLISMQLEAADFRTSDFGESCTLLKEREAALGGQPVPWEGEGPNKQGFKTKLLGRDVYVLYLCKDGALLIGNYLFPKETREPAIETLHAMYDDLVATYGAPSFDSSPWQHGETAVDPRAIVEPGYLTTWKTTRIDVTAGLMPAGANWQVLVVIRSADCAERSPSPANAPVTDP